MRNTKPFDLRFSVNSLETAAANSDYVQALQDAMLENFKETKVKLIASYQRYRKYYDKKLAHNLFNFTNTACFSTQNLKHN